MEKIDFFTTNIDIIIIRYLDGSASLEEKLQILQWLKESEKNRCDFTDTRDLWLSCNVASDNELEVDIALDRLKTRILSEHKRIERKTRRSFIHWYQVAAVVLVLLGWYFWFSNEPPEPKLIVQNQLITAKGSKGKFTLPDSTVVWLNSESRLVYPDQFADGKRIVTLVGGAYFEVVKDEKRPFIVKAGDINLEVLGTSFNISSYPFKDYIETALLSGSVKITGNSVHTETYLKPNEVFKYQKESLSSSIKPANASLYADWIKDRLTFDNCPLSDILISMEGWYNTDIVCPEKFAESTYMSFTIRQENMDEILRAISFIIPIKYQIKDEKIFIIPKQ